MNSNMISKALYNLTQHIYYQDRSGNKEGYVKIYPNNTYQHELVKFQICKKLKEDGFKIYTECRFKLNKGRADIVAISNFGVGYIIEVVNTEKEKSINEKRNKYPHEFSLLQVNTKDFNIKEFKL